MPSRDQDFLEFVLDQLSRLEGVTSKRMFGGIGLYHGPVFFGIIDEGKLYFVTGDDSRRRYESRGMRPFEYAPGKVLRTYYEVPVDVLEDDTDLVAWAREAVAVQKGRAPRPKSRPKARQTTRKSKRG